MFDQYEHESRGQESDTLDDDAPQIFQKSKILLEPTEDISHMVVCDNLMVIAMVNNVLYRIDPKKSRTLQYQEIELNKLVPGVKLTGLYLDPTADHLLITFATELIYLNRKSSKPKQVTKMKGHEVTAVAWHATAGNPGDQTTKPILLGTSRGHIFELEINGDEGIFVSSIEVYCKQVFDLGGAQAIIGLEFHRIEGSDMYFVIATTAERLYQFVGKARGEDDRPLLQPLFHRYLGQEGEAFQSLLALHNARLQLSSERPGQTPSLICWPTHTGFYMSEIDAKNSKPMENLFKKGSMTNYPFSNELPLSYLKTDFHILYLYPNFIVGVLSLAQETTVFTDYFPENDGRLVNITKDPIKGSLWIYSERAVFRYKVTDEDRHVWQFYADQGNYEKAKFFCSKDPIKMDKVLRLQAESLFKENQYEDSARVFAQTQSSVEQVALNFFDAEQNGALKIYLKEKLKRLQAGDKAQTTMLILWILELLLGQLGNLRSAGRHNETSYMEAQEELEDFLKIPATLDCLKSNRQAVYALMSSHGDQKNLVKLAKATKDYDKVISIHINQGEVSSALEMLRKQPNIELWYTHLSRLLQADSRLTLNALHSISQSINPARILPSLIAAYNPANAEEMIKTIEYCVNETNCTDEAVHNFFVYLLAQHSPTKLDMYLAVQGKEPSMVNYDIRYAVRICRQSQGNEASCVHLYTLLGLWESAVDLALQVGLPLARQIASQPSDSAQSKKLWLKIAQHLVKKEDNLMEALKLVESCPSVKIEDALPFFPDVTTIDHFKDAICAALQECNQKIDNLKEEMEDASKSAQLIRDEIHSFRSKFSTIQSNDVCSACSKTLLTSPFYTFPCEHRFHINCLITEKASMLSPANRDTLLALVRKEETAVGSAERDRFRTELDGLLASQCLYCGDLMIDLIDKPFMDEEDYERIKKEWE